MSTLVKHLSVWLLWKFDVLQQTISISTRFQQPKRDDFDDKIMNNCQSKTTQQNVSLMTLLEPTVQYTTDTVEQQSMIDNVTQTVQRFPQVQFDHSEICDELAAT